MTATELVRVCHFFLEALRMIVVLNDRGIVPAP